MNIKRLDVLLAIDKYKNVSKAAKHLNLKQPTVTFHMKNLEKEMNTRIFLTNSSVTTLTQAGKALLDYARRIILLSKDATRVMESFNPDTSYNIRIGSSNVPASYLLPQGIKLFKESCNHSSFTITVMTAPEIQNMLLDYKIDLGFVSSTDSLLDNINRIKVYTDEMVLVYSKDNPLAMQDTITEDQLRHQPFIFHSQNSTTRTLTNLWMKETGLILKTSIEINSVESIKKAVMCNLGVAILTKLAVEKELKSGELLFSHLPNYSPSRNIYIIYNKEKYMPNIVQEFIHTLQNSIVNV